MVTKRSRGLVNYDGLPTVIRNFFKMLPERGAKGSRRRDRKEKEV